MNSNGLIKHFKRVTSVVLSLLMTVSAVVLLLPGASADVSAAAPKSIVGLGICGISEPDSNVSGSANKDKAWNGSYVWYGHFGSEPVKYRVLAPAITIYNTSGKPYMLLDCDSVLSDRRFDDDSSTWSSSELNTYLNGTGFLGNTSYFTAAESSAIAASTISGHALNTGSAIDNWFTNYVGLTGEKIFILDFEDSLNTSYGYCDFCGWDGNSSWVGVGNRVKYYIGTTNTAWWWLRSADISSFDAGCVYDDGRTNVYDATFTFPGVSPAFNIIPESVIFTSLIPNTGNSGSYGAQYKLTVVDQNMQIAVPSGETVTRSGDVVTVPFAISGTNVNNADKVSIILWKGSTPYTAGTACTDTSKYAYIELSVSDIASGTGTFTLPDSYKNLTCGTDYYAYMIAEDINGAKETDYASTPVAITVPASSGGSSAQTPPTTPAVVTASEPEPPVNYMQEVEDKITSAIALGGPQTVYIEGYSALSYHVLEMLKDHPEITLVSEFTYDGMDYKITIPGSAVVLNPDVNWYGPKYLFPMFYMYGTDTMPSLQAYIDKYK